MGICLWVGYEKGAKIKFTRIEVYHKYDYHFEGTLVIVGNIVTKNLSQKRCSKKTLRLSDSRHKKHQQTKKPISYVITVNKNKKSNLKLLYLTCIFLP